MGKVGRREKGAFLGAKFWARIFGKEEQVLDRPFSDRNIVVKEELEHLHNFFGHVKTDFVKQTDKLFGE